MYEVCDEKLEYSVEGKYPDWLPNAFSEFLEK